MLNKEKYEKEILEIACGGDSIALTLTDNLVSCNELACSCCKFNDEDHIGCREAAKDWCNSEYKEPEIDWSQVPIDTPIYVNLPDGWKPRYFYMHYSDEGIYHFNGGRTSFTKLDANDYSFKLFSSVKLARKEDIEKYSK